MIDADLRALTSSAAKMRDQCERVVAAEALFNVVCLSFALHSRPWRVFWMGLKFRPYGDGITVSFDRMPLGR